MGTKTFDYKGDNLQCKGKCRQTVDYKPMI